jgi:hypothetical protein
MSPPTTSDSLSRTEVGKVAEGNVCSGAFAEGEKMSFDNEGWPVNSDVPRGTEVNGAPVSWEGFGEGAPVGEGEGAGDSLGISDGIPEGNPDGAAVGRAVLALFLPLFMF